jgi:hypothetical protein
MNKSTPIGSERRRSQRQRPKPSTEIARRSQPLRVGPNVALSVLDISADGIRLLVNTRLDQGQRIEVGLEGIGYCRPLQLTAEVVWSLQTADGNWCIGAKF